MLFLSLFANIFKSLFNKNYNMIKYNSLLKNIQLFVFLRPNFTFYKLT